nr:reverse transcriptase domain-containing protein [Tanacetum cinerariifolium]
MILGCSESLKANLQHMEALSTTEARYMMFTEAWKKEIWLKGLLTESRYELRHLREVFESEIPVIHMSGEDDNPQVGGMADHLRPMEELLQAPTEARTWLEKETLNFITTWDDLVSKFVNQFFPPSKTTSLRNAITNFRQNYDEAFSEVWERFKDLLKKRPHHGFSPLHKIDTFYNGLNQLDQDSLNSVAGGVLPSNTVTNPREELKDITTRSGMTLDGPFIPRSNFLAIPKEERELKTITKEVQFPSSQSTTHFPPLFLNMFKELHINIKLVDALAQIPKYAKLLKDLLTNKENLEDLANTLLNAICSAIILKKLPENLGDPGKFLIPCFLKDLDVCNALTNLGTSIKLMCYSLYLKLGMGALKPTTMSL